MEKKKKRIIISSIIVGVIAFVLLLSSAVFSIRSVGVEYQTTLTCLSKEELNKMIANADFPIGKSIFFEKFDDNIRAMEKAYPYVKINGVERKFPSYLVVYVSERTPVVRFGPSGNELILDSELKVLNVAQKESDYNILSGEDELPLLTISSGSRIPGFSVDAAEKTIGDFLRSDQLASWVKAFYEGAVCTTSSLDSKEAISCINMIETIDVSYASVLEKVQFSITYKDLSVTSKIVGEEDLTNTIYKVISSVISVGGNYAEINASGGVVYAKEK